MSVKQININVTSSHHKKPIVTDVMYSQNSSKKSIVIFCHGYKGYKDWGCWNLMANVFVKSNLFFVKFNFSHNGGTLEEPIDFPDLNAFGENNFSIELNDLEDVINWIVKNPNYKDEVNIENITLIGHSRGGGIVTIKASENNQISKVITLNGVSDYAARFPKGKDLEMWKKHGISYVLNSRTNQKMPHLYQFYQNFIDNEEQLTIKNAVKKLDKPYLIVGGTDDVVVPSIEAENLHSCNPFSELFLVEEMNHTLGSKHPWLENELPIHMNHVIKKCISFIKNGVE